MSIRYDVLFLYNERETVVDEIVKELDYSGYATFFWRRDVPGGTPVEVEANLFDSVNTILVLLGSQGWGPTHLEIAQKAIDQQKRVLPVLIGPAPSDAFNELDSLFIKMRYADLQQRNEQTYDQLMRLIGPPETYRNTNRFNSIISRITDGNNEERLRVINQIRNSRTINRAALSIRLREEIENRFRQPAENESTVGPRPQEQVSTIRS